MVELIDVTEASSNKTKSDGAPYNLEKELIKEDEAQVWSDMADGAHLEKNRLYDEKMLAQRKTLKPQELKAAIKAALKAEDKLDEAIKHQKKNTEQHKRVNFFLNSKEESAVGAAEKAAGTTTTTTTV